MVTTKQITDVMDKIDTARESAQPIDISNMTELNEFRNTNRGQLILHALEEYGNSSFMTTATSQEKKEEEKRRRKRTSDLIVLLTSQRELLDQYIDAAQKYKEAVDDYGKDADEFKKTMDEANETMKQVISSLAEKATTDADKELVKEMQDQQQELDKYSVAVDQQITKLHTVIDAIHQASLKVSNLCGPGNDNAEGCLIAMDKLDQARIKFTAIKTEFNNTVEMVSQVYQGLLENISKFTEGKDLSPEEEALIDKLKAKAERIQEISEELKNGNLTIEEYDARLNEIKTKFKETNEAIKLVSEDPNLAKFKEALEKFTTTNTRLTDALDQATSAQTTAILKDYESSIQGLEKIQNTMTKYAGMDRMDFMADHRDGYSWLKHHLGENLGGIVFKNYDLEHDYVLTQDGNVVFQEDGQYYYYKDNQPGTTPIIINDPEELQHVLAEGWSEDNPKFFGNDTSYGAEFEGLGKNFLAGTRGGEDISTTTDNLNNTIDSIKAKQAAVDATNTENTTTTANNTAKNTPPNTQEQYHIPSLEEQYGSDPVMSQFAKWRDLSNDLLTRTSDFTKEQNEIYFKNARLLSELTEQATNTGNERAYLDQHLDKTKNAIQQLQALQNGDTPQETPETKPKSALTSTFTHAHDNTTPEAEAEPTPSEDPQHIIQQGLTHAF